MPPKKKPVAKKQETVARFKVGDVECELDANRLTWGEGEEAEVYFGCALHEIDWESTRAAMFMAYLARKRAEPDFSLDDLRAMDIDEVEVLEDRPTESAPQTSGSQS